MYIDKGEVLKQEYSQPPILPSRLVVNIYFLNVTLGMDN